MTSVRRAHLPTFVRTWDVTLEQRYVRLVAQSFAPPAAGVGCGSALHLDEVRCSDDRDVELTQGRWLGAQDIGVELGIERQLNGLTAGVLEVDAMGKPARD
jgi:hypothetical protein